MEEWGGIAYALSALRSALPDEWRILPMLKIGRDLSEQALRFLRGIPGMDLSAVQVVPEPNNRVELHYQTEEKRVERLVGGVPPWSWPELAPALDLCDALYVNFISGFEMELATAQAVRTGFTGPTYADLHSLFLGVGRQGTRVPQELPHWGQWLRCFDGVQMNEDEFELLGRAWGDPWQLAADSVGPELRLIAVTLGARGAAYVVASDFHPDPHSWRRGPGEVALAGSARSGRVTSVGLARSGDPTGCGDVWGATLFSRLLLGDELEAAMGEANRLAARNVEHRGATGLYRHLAGRLSRVEE